MPVYYFFSLSTMGATILFLLVLWMLPTIIVFNNKNKVSKWPTVIVDVFLSWTIIGWFVALAMSLSKDATPVIINNNVSHPEATKKE